ncbi:MAG: hypothetical protein IJZ39_08025 [Oscillospiraceae bacterium]|nr:hypothetical protein [Oscillospiraceae bacterium]
MALLFSAVTVTAGDAETEFLVSGIPREYDDLSGWKAFDDFLEELDTDTDVVVRAGVYLYGEGETFRASLEEVAYLTRRLEMNEQFLRHSCDGVEDVTFSFGWSPEELFGMKIN